jgi:hypothetical protein
VGPFWTVTEKVPPLSTVDPLIWVLLGKDSDPVVTTQGAAEEHPGPVNIAITDDKLKFVPVIVKLKGTPATGGLGVVEMLEIVGAPPWAVDTLIWAEAVPVTPFVLVTVSVIALVAALNAMLNFCCVLMTLPLLCHTKAEMVPLPALLAEPSSDTMTFPFCGADTDRVPLLPAVRF